VCDRSRVNHRWPAETGFQSPQGEGPPWANGSNQSGPLEGPPGSGTVRPALGNPLIQGIGSGVVMVLLAWPVGAQAALLIVDVADVHQSTGGTLTVDTVAVALGALCGHLWAERNRVEHEALDKAAALQSASDGHIERAVKAERLQVARELHGVASHAVGVMVLLSRPGRIAAAIGGGRVQDGAAAVPRTAACPGVVASGSASRWSRPPGSASR
jgi:hypothetical protein